MALHAGKALDIIGPEVSPARDKLFSGQRFGEAAAFLRSKTAKPKADDLG